MVMSSAVNTPASAGAARRVYVPDPADDSDGPPECRICRGEAEPGNPLHVPCRCRGSIRYCHEDCLVRWLDHSGKDACELCGVAFDFAPVYAEGAPERLPARALAAAGAAYVWKAALPLALRVACSVALWLGVAPLATCMLYRAWIHEPSEPPAAWTGARVLEELGAGLAIVAAIVVSFLSLLSFTDYMRVRWELLELERAPRPERAAAPGERLDDDDDGDGDDERTEVGIPAVMLSYEDGARFAKAVSDGHAASVRVFKRPVDASRGVGVTVVPGRSVHVAGRGRWGVYLNAKPGAPDDWQLYIVRTEMDDDAHFNIPEPAAYAAACRAAIWEQPRRDSHACRPESTRLHPRSVGGAMSAFGGAIADFEAAAEVAACRCPARTCFVHGPGNPG